MRCGVAMIVVLLACAAEPGTGETTAGTGTAAEGTSVASSGPGTSTTVSTGSSGVTTVGTAATSTGETDEATTTGGAASCDAAIEGYGAMTVGGEGGDEYHVTTLDDAGPGSLREGIEDRDGPRRIVFDLGGTIGLVAELGIVEPFLTIDGCTAPAPGITITHATGDTSLLGIYGTHDVVVRGLRFVGRWQPGEATVEGVKAIGIDGDSGPDQVTANVVLDHLTIAFAGDGAFDLWGEVHDVTLSWSIVHDSSRGGLVSHYPAPYQVRQRISYHHNVYARNTERNPQIRADVRDFDYVNNVLYEWGFHDPASGYGIRIRNDGDEPPVHGNFIANAFVSSIAPESAFIDEGTGSQLWVADNVFPPEPVGDPSTLAAGLPVPVWAAVTTSAATELADVVLPGAGAPYRTAEEDALLAEIAGAL